jgi:hypothetical protein
VDELGDEHGTKAKGGFMKYFLDLNFYPEAPVELGGSLAQKRLYWTLLSYLLLAIGIFCRQCIPLPAQNGVLDFSFANVRLTVALASSIIALAIFPPFTRWFNRRFRNASWGHLMWAFTFGFFVDLSNKAIAHILR